jgi:hypothetical protein
MSKKAPDGLPHFLSYRESWREPGLCVLLAIQAAFIFMVVPLVEMEHSRILLHLFQGALALVTAAAIAERPRLRGLILITFAATLLSPAIPHGFGGASYALASYFLFNAIVTWVIAESVFSAEHVTHHRIMGAAAVYLNLAWLFGMIYRESATLIPHAFSLPPGSALTLDQLLYFSLGMLTTSGAGDILPVHPVVRSIANLESIVGQFFLAVLVSRLVGLHIAQRAARRGA